MKSLALLGASALFLLSACGGDSDSATSPTKSRSADMEVATYEMLPSCAEKREGKTAYVKDQDQGYICQNEKWVESDDAVDVYPSSTVKPSINNGYYTDSRDGKKYRTVTIGTQIWMAENLNFKTDSSFCYNDKESNCSKYGRLYMWSAAVRACPNGWHLPSETEWDDLFSFVGGIATGKMLKAASGWKDGGNGDDPYSFTALPAGCGNSFESRFGEEGSGAFFWSSTETKSDGAYYVDMFYDIDQVNKGSDNKNDGLSVRCIWNDGFEESKNSSEKGKLDVSSSSNSDIKNSVKMGSLKDSRDGQTYKTVQIGDQVWMAENLNFKTESSFCYNDSAEYCSKYGRLYTWASAMDSAGLWSTNGKGCGYNDLVYDYPCSSTSLVRGACPEGWHLPSIGEWRTLLNAVGGSSVAGKVLKSISGWEENLDNNGNGTDAFSFSAFPAGVRANLGGGFSNQYSDDDISDGDVNHNGYGFEGKGAFFWSSTEDGYITMPYIVYLESHSDNADLNMIFKSLGLSVRCLKD